VIGALDEGATQVTATVVELGFEVTGAFGLFGIESIAPPP